MKIKKINGDFSICKVRDYSMVNFFSEFCFTGKTDEENSLVCLSEDVPENVLEVDDGWKMFRIEGVLDFSLVGILSKISSILAENKIGIFAVSTFNTDYILVKEENYDKALSLLEREGYEIAWGRGLSIRPDWEDIIYRGNITGTYKFALAETLIIMAAEEKDCLSFREMAKIYADQMIRHIREYPRQITADGSSFLRACVSYDSGEIQEKELIEITVKEGLKYVLDRFHIVDGAKVRTEFYTVENPDDGKRTVNSELCITKEMKALVMAESEEELFGQVEDRWNEVEIKWSK